jgi:hypothetical protein
METRRMTRAVGKPTADGVRIACQKARNHTCSAGLLVDAYDAVCTLIRDPQSARSDLTGQREPMFRA